MERKTASNVDVFLWGKSTQRWTVAQIAQKTGLSEATVRKRLQALEDIHKVSRDLDMGLNGRSVNLYQWDSDHAARRNLSDYRLEEQA